ncbi:hypothetical protein GCM10008110_17190 [Marinobacter persicus]|nr:hypothetical protein GCM10008110_17190 [Marinobacter persicus]
MYSDLLRGPHGRTLQFSRPPQKAANLSINSDLLSKTRELNFNLSATLERALKEELSKREAAQWVEKIALR